MSHYLDLPDTYLDLYKSLPAKFGTEAQVRKVVDQLSLNYEALRKQHCRICRSWLKNKVDKHHAVVRARTELRGAQELLQKLQEITLWDPDITVIELIRGDGDIIRGDNNLVLHLNERQTKVYLWVCELIGLPPRPVPVSIPAPAAEPVAA